MADIAITFQGDDMVNLLNYKTAGDFPGKDSIPDVCDICGVKPPTGFWDCHKSLSVCRECAMSVLPNLIVDSSYSAKGDGWNDSKKIIRSVTEQLRKAMLFVACGEARSARGVD